MAVATQKAYKGIGMEGGIARWYEKTTRQYLPEFRNDADRFADMLLSPNSSILEVAPGPGFLSIELARKKQFHVTALDISKTFVEIAKTNAQQAGVTVDFRLGNASVMPFPDSTFDFLVCRAAFKNFTQPERALREMRRVLRPGARGVIIDLRRDASMCKIGKHVRSMDLSTSRRILTKLTFRFMLLKRAYTIPEFENMLQSIGFTKTEIHPNDVGMEIWFEK
ncbi:methyltransferase type 11 [Edaphobacter acidisoli]|uniref:Methyltransferase type 11 n=1 Tax=Edaphobacter acidisoli TaxID=2040573 RepID=A0A916RUN8_9BACT|nr:class I SAM-dependent methyltransferase [Edaphobacter acidisoli]GGA71337.1 methyltransferase type 11 [Edaphobacter acidisoli]